MLNFIAVRRFWLVHGFVFQAGCLFLIVGDSPYLGLSLSVIHASVLWIKVNSTP